MLLPSLLTTLLRLTSALSLKPSQIPAIASRYLFSNPPVEDADYEIPTIHESAIMARRILQLSSLGTLVTSFPSTSSSDEASTAENRPSEVQGSPIGLMEYYADCEGDGNPTMLAINIATPYKNYHAGSNISLSVRWWPKASNIYYSTQSDSSERTLPDTPDIPTPHTPAALPRFSLHGYLESISTNDLIRHFIPGCFLRAHPDSVLWQPGNDISHESEYVRLVVEEVYWFGGFGDRARIGWLPVEEWRGVTQREIEGCRLPGEKGEGKDMESGEAEEGQERWREWL